MACRSKRTAGAPHMPPRVAPPPMARHGSLVTVHQGMHCRVMTLCDVLMCIWLHDLAWPAGERGWQGGGRGLA